MSTITDSGNFLITGADLLHPVSIIDVSKMGCRIQEARLFAALLESGWGLKVNEKQVGALRSTQKFFPVCVSSYSGRGTHSIPITINHSIPLTRFGHVERPLIFPMWLASRKSLVGQKRKYLVSFQGLPTRERVSSALRFVELNFGPVSYGTKKFLMLLNRIPRSRLRTTFLNHTFQGLDCARHIRIFWSEDGRLSANKVVESEYWKTLADSFSVYCPPGDFRWTYRFYEAMLAGALPILEEGSNDEFAKPFHKAFSVNQAKKMLDNEVPGFIEENRRKVTELLTAFDSLRPCNHQ